MCKPYWCMFWHGWTNMYKGIQMCSPRFNSNSINYCNLWNSNSNAKSVKQTFSRFPFVGWNMSLSREENRLYSNLNMKNTFRFHSHLSFLWSSSSTSRCWYDIVSESSMSNIWLYIKTHLQRQIDFFCGKNNNVYMYFTKLHPQKIDFSISAAAIATQSIDALLHPLIHSFFRSFTHLLNHLLALIQSPAQIFFRGKIWCGGKWLS